MSQRIVCRHPDGAAWPQVIIDLPADADKVAELLLAVGKLGYVLVRDDEAPA